MCVYNKSIKAHLQNYKTTGIKEACVIPMYDWICPKNYLISLNIT